MLVADRQVSGRGRHNRNWASPAGGLYVSILLQLPDVDSPITLIPLTVGLALHTSLIRLTKSKNAALNLRLKWPNDVMTPRGKLAGILCESNYTPDGWQVIAGVGVNLLPLNAEMKDRLDIPATSLVEESGISEWTREEVLAAFLLELASRTKRWERDPESLRKDWIQAADLVGRQLTVKTAEGPVSGIARGISSAGALQLSTADGEIEIHASEGIEENS